MLRVPLFQIPPLLSPCSYCSWIPCSTKCVSPLLSSPCVGERRRVWLPRHVGRMPGVRAASDTLAPDQMPGGNPGVFLQLLQALPGLLHLTVFRLQCHSSRAVTVVCWTGNLKPCFRLISSDLPSPCPSCLPPGNTVNRHMAAALRLNSFPREMEGWGDGRRNRVVGARRERHVTVAGQLGGWISPVHQVEVSGLLIHRSGREALIDWSEKTCSVVEQPPPPSHLSRRFPPLSLSVSSSLSPQASPHCSESWFSLSKWPHCFSAGEFTSDVYTEAWTGPQAMPAIDFAMILIRGLPVAIDTIHQWTARWNWWSQIGSHIWLPINHAVDYFLRLKGSWVSTRSVSIKNSSAWGAPDCPDISDTERNNYSQ